MPLYVTPLTGIVSIKGIAGKDWLWHDKEDIVYHFELFSKKLK